jgi:peptidoglycan/xylan/chitin deacetylase (PgdA/CDA1 family)
MVSTYGADMFLKKYRTLIIILAAVAGALVIAAALNRWKTEIRLTGKSNVTVEYGKDYKDPGAYAEQKGTSLFFIRKKIPVKRSGKVDTKKLGRYILTYTAGSSKKVSVKRIVKVRDTTPPKIELIHKKDYFTPIGQKYVEEGYKAYDACDGDLTDKVKVTEQDGYVYYSVSDNSGNRREARRKIVFDDRTAPVITLSNGNEINIRKGDSWKDKYSAEDDVDGDLTAKVKTEGKVNTSKIGTYKIKYTVIDAHGNKASAERTVHVLNRPMNNPGRANGKKIIYLTFDDGPGPYTEKLLGILKKYNVKATFFVTHSKPDYQHMIAAEAADGHKVGIHTYTHDYAKIYSSTEAYWNDFDEMQNVVVEETGQKTDIFRFPGGSSNEVSMKYTRGIMTTLTSQSAERGLTYFDWNVSSGDAAPVTDGQTVMNNIRNGVQKHDVSVVLCHDVKEFTVNIMDETIAWCLENGYTFLPLSSSSPTAHHSVHN